MERLGRSSTSPTMLPFQRRRPMAHRVPLAQENDPLAVHVFLASTAPLYGPQAIPVR